AQAASTSARAGDRMTTCERIQSEAAGLAALAPGDPERVAAFGHARTCPACAQALDEGVALLRLLELAAPAEAPRPEALALAAAAAGGALAGQAALEITCHALRTHLHLFTFHSGGVLLALVLGAAIGRAAAPTRG